ncbi:NHLP-related RiPP peptide [Streptomyces sp. NPDC050504]|uniref:NHLP-related RiPP peptide n=1 Tax=Streptomyces sp. NPDC050504 TaxID=3365618 RepID=UPI003798E29A
MPSAALDTKPRIPHRVADRLLELLATDDAFRELFKADRHAALVQAGLDADPSQLKEASALGCLVVNELASKSDIAAARDTLKAHLTSDASHTNPHAFEAGAMHAVLREG